MAAPFGVGSSALRALPAWERHAQPLTNAAPLGHEGDGSELESFTHRGLQRSAQRRAFGNDVVMTAPFSYPPDTSDVLAAGDASVCLGRGIDLVRGGSPKEALPFLFQASALRPSHAGTLQALGAALLRSGEPGEALRAFDDAVAIAPLIGALHHGRGLALHRLGDRGRALHAFRTACDLAPSNPVHWASLSETAHDERERVYAIAQRAAALTASTAMSNAHPEQLKETVRAMIDAHAFDQAIEFIGARLHRFGPPAAAWSQLAQAYYRSGRFEHAFHFAQRALRGELSAAGNPKPASPFPADLAFDALVDVWSLLESHHLPCFLAAGTLLGMYRNGGLLSHDRDVDVGILCPAGARPDIAAILREADDIALPPDARAQDRYFGFRFRGIAIDIFLYEQTADGVLSGFSDNAGDIQWRHTPFALRSADFQGRVWRIPDPTERYLAETYSESWREPDLGFASAVSSPALYGASDAARGYCAVSRARSYLSRDNRAKAAALLQQCPLSLHAITQTAFGQHVHGDPDMR